MANEKKVLIIDKQTLFREGIKTIISNTPCLKMAGETDNPCDGLTLVNTIKPEILLIDISLPEKNGIKLTQEIIDEFNHPPLILIISIYTKVAYIISSLQAGARGYVYKESPPETFVEAMDTILSGHLYLDTSLDFNAFNYSLKGLYWKDFTNNISNTSLTSRELEIVKLLAKGMKVREIANLLFISAKTVENHKTNIMRKLELNNPIELVHYASKTGLINLDS